METSWKILNLEFGMSDSCDVNHKTMAIAGLEGVALERLKCIDTVWPKVK